VGVVVAVGRRRVLEPALPEPSRPGASRTALAALQAYALAQLTLPSGVGGIADRLYAPAAARGREHLEAASDPSTYEAAVSASILPGPGRVSRVAGRKRWLTQTAAQTLSTGVRQVVVLGAGFETLGLQLLSADQDLLVVELDRPPTLQAKAEALSAAEIPRPWPRLAAVDLGDAATLSPALGAVGWRASEPTLFVAEVVLEYLAPEAALAVLAALRSLAAPGSRLAWTVRFGDVSEDHLASATAAAGEPMRFRPIAAELPGLIADAGFDVLAERGGAHGPGGAGSLLLLAPSPRR
jgi:methyltransferase (TIGR00027 family)